MTQPDKPLLPAGMRASSVAPQCVSGEDRGRGGSQGGSGGYKRSVARLPAIPIRHAPPITPPSHSLGEPSLGSRKEQDIGQFRDKEEAITLGPNSQQDTIAVSPVPVWDSGTDVQLGGTGQERRWGLWDLPLAPPAPSSREGQGGNL